MHEGFESEAHAGTVGEFAAAPIASEERARGTVAASISAGHASDDGDSEIAIPRTREITHSTIAVRALGSSGRRGLHGGPAIRTEGDTGSTVRIGEFIREKCEAYYCLS